MVDFLNPSTFPIQPASRALEDRPETKQRRRETGPAKKPEKMEEVGDEESGEQEHSLDLDA